SSALAAVTFAATPASILIAAIPIEAPPSSTDPRTIAPPAPAAPRGNPAPPPSPASSKEPAVPPIPAPVVDTAGILDADDERVLESLAYDVRQTTSAEIAVLTVRTTAPLDEFTYGMKVVSAWQLGSAEKDDGLLLLVAVDDHRARFFPGYGLEGVLPDGRLGAILDRFVVPEF